MALPAGCGAGWEEVAKRKQERASGSSARESKKRIEREHKRGGMMLLAKPGMKLRKASRPRDGPYRVIKANTNGTLKIQLRPCVADVVNLRRVHPFFEKEDT